MRPQIFHEQTALVHANMIRHKELEPTDVPTANNRVTDGYRRMFPTDD